MKIKFVYHTFAGNRSDGKLETVDKRTARI